MSPLFRGRVLWRFHTRIRDRTEQTSAPSEKSPEGPFVDLSADSARYATTHHLLVTLPYLTQETTPRELASAMGKSPRQVRRITSQLLALGLIADRRHIQLVDNWEEVWDRLAEEKGTAGKKQAAIEKLAQDRLASQTGPLAVHRQSCSGR
jgi:DNA-binding transcriptional ArsR family regulator